MNLEGVNVESILQTKYPGVGDNKVIDMFLATWQPPATPLPLTQDLQEVSQTQLSGVETTESTATQSTIDLQPVTMYQPDSPQDTNP